jgi:hypothetical protein
MRALYAFILIGAVSLPPVLATLAIRGWARSFRKDLPRWRNAIAITSIGLTFLNWLAFLFLAFTLLLGSRATFFSAGWTGINILLATAGTLLSLALKGTSRPQVLVAGLLMVSMWVISLANQ